MSPRERPSQEQVMREKYEPRQRDAHERVIALRKRFESEDSANRGGVDATVTDIRNRNHALQELITRLTDAAARGVQTQVDHYELDIEAKLHEFETVVRPLEQQPTTYETGGYPEFVTQRTGLLNDMNSRIDDPATDAETKKALHALRKEVIAVCILSGEVLQRQNTIIRERGFDADNLTQAQDDDTLATAKADISDTKREALTALRQKLSAIEGAGRTRASTATAERQQKAKGERGAKARELLQKTLHGEALDPKEVVERIDSHLGRLVDSALAEVAGEGGSKAERAAEKEQLLLEVAWSLLGKQGDPPRSRAEFNTFVSALTNVQEAERATFWLATAEQVRSDAVERIKQDATQQLRDERQKKGFWKSTAFPMGARLLGYGGGALAVTAATGPVGWLAGGAIGVGMIGARVLDTYISGNRVEKKKQHEMVEQYKSNFHKQGDLRRAMIDAFVTEGNKRLRKDKSSEGTLIVDVSEIDQATGARRDYQEEQAYTLEEIREHLRKGTKMSEGDRQEFRDAYRDGIRNAIYGVPIRGATGEILHHPNGTIQRDLATGLRHKIRDAIIHDTELAALPREQKVQLLASTLALYETEQMHLLDDEETAVGLECTKDIGTRFVEALSRKKTNEKVKTAAIMATMGLVARHVPGLRQVLFGYAGFELGAVGGEYAYRFWTGDRGGVAPTKKAVEALQKRIQSATDPAMREMLLMQAKDFLGKAHVALASEKGGGKLSRAELRRAVEGLEQMLVAEEAINRNPGRIEQLWKTVRDEKGRAISREEAMKRWKWGGRIVGAAAAIGLGEGVRYLSEQWQEHVKAEEAKDAAAAVEAQKVVDKAAEDLAKEQADAAKAVAEAAEKQAAAVAETKKLAEEAAAEASAPIPKAWRDAATSGDPLAYATETSGAPGAVVTPGSEPKHFAATFTRDGGGTATQEVVYSDNAEQFMREHGWTLRDGKIHANGDIMNMQKAATVKVEMLPRGGAHVSAIGEFDARTGEAAVSHFYFDQDGHMTSLTNVDTSHAVGAAHDFAQGEGAVAGHVTAPGLGAEGSGDWTSTRLHNDGGGAVESYATLRTIDEHGVHHEYATTVYDGGDGSVDLADTKAAVYDVAESTRGAAPAPVGVLDKNNHTMTPYAELAAGAKAKTGTTVDFARMNPQGRLEKAQELIADLKNNPNLGYRSGELLHWNGHGVDKVPFAVGDATTTFTGDTLTVTHGNYTLEGTLSSDGTHVTVSGSSFTLEQFKAQAEDGIFADKYNFYTAANRATVDLLAERHGTELVPKAGVDAATLTRLEAFFADAASPLSEPVVYGTDPEKLVFAIEHYDDASPVAPAELSQTFADRDILHTKLGTNLSPDAVLDLRDAVRTQFNLAPNATIFETTSEGNILVHGGPKVREMSTDFLLTRDGVELTGLPTKDAALPEGLHGALNGESLRAAIPMGGATKEQIADAMKDLAGKAAVQEELAGRIAESMKVGGILMPDIDTTNPESAQYLSSFKPGGAIAEMPLTDYNKGQDAFLDKLKVSHGWARITSPWSEEVSGEHTWNELQKIFTEAGVRPEKSDRTVGDLLKRAIDALAAKRP